MPGWVLVVVALLGLILIITYIVWYFSPAERMMRSMRSMRLCALADVVVGERCRVAGEVALVESVEAPLSGRLCAYWRVVVQEKRGRTGQQSFVEIIDHQSGVDFLIVDGSEKALVRTAHCQAVLESKMFTSDSIDGIDPRLEAFLQQHGHSGADGRGMNFLEGIVTEGERVAVVGIARMEADPETQALAGDGYRDAKAPVRLVMDAAEDGPPVLVSDKPAQTKPVP